MIGERGCQFCFGTGKMEYRSERGAYDGPCPKCHPPEDLIE